MGEMIRKKWKCKVCEEEIVSYSNTRHQMDVCMCGASAVDLEEHYLRTMGRVEFICTEKLNENNKWEDLTIKTENDEKPKRDSIWRRFKSYITR